MGLAMKYLTKSVLFSTIVVASAAAIAGGDLKDEHWLGRDAQSTETVNHSAWDSLLKRYIQRDEALQLNRFDYGAVGDEDHQALKSYIDALEAVTVTDLNPAEQKAYWINLYNAFTVDVILDAYPVDSIRAIGGGLFSRGPWGDDDYTVTVEGRDLTLDDIEHGILRPIYDDSRVHYGVNCASVGCPNLDRDAYTGARVDQMLEENAQDFIASPRGLQDISNRGAKVSSIYHWFKEDFGGDDAGVLAHLKQFGGSEVAERLEGVSRVRGHDYDWSLNDTARVSTN
ncbi:MAG: DUF547 domain-containing protein [Rhodothalassiaceae bacterium]